MAKRTSKKTRKQASSSRSKSTRKKAGARKKSSKKASTRKKATTGKKATTKKKVSAGKPSSKSKSKKSTSKSTSKKTSTKKGTTTKSRSKGSSSSSSKASALRNGDVTVKPSGPRFRSHFAGDRDSNRAAAAKLAQAAGLSEIRSAAAAAQQSKKRYRRLSKSPFNDEQLREFRGILLEKRSQLVGDVTSMESEALGGGDGGSLSHLPQHMADQGSDTFEQSLNLDLAASQRGLLKEIDDALDRIDRNRYGICELLGKPIKIDRLRNTPWARFSIEAARQLELNPHLVESLGD